MQAQLRCRPVRPVVACFHDACTACEVCATIAWNSPLRPRPTGEAGLARALPCNDNPLHSGVGVLMQRVAPPHFERAVRAVLVVDVVESVRMMQEDEEGAVGLWR